MDGSLADIVTGGKRKNCAGTSELLPVAAAGGHPAMPFVVGEDGEGDEDEGENAEENFHKRPGGRDQGSVKTKGGAKGKG